MAAKVSDLIPGGVSHPFARTAEHAEVVDYALIETSRVTSDCEMEVKREPRWKEAERQSNWYMAPNGTHGTQAGWAIGMWGDPDAIVYGLEFRDWRNAVQCRISAEYLQRSESPDQLFAALQRRGIPFPFLYIHGITGAVSHLIYDDIPESDSLTRHIATVIMERSTTGKVPPDKAHRRRQ